MHSQYLERGSGGEVSESPVPDILLVEDNPDIAELEIRILEKRGFSIRHATTTRGGILLYNEHKPDLIILDLNLPDIGGWQLLEYARQRGRVPPVIVTSANDDMLNRINGKLYNVNHYLVKPVSKHILVEAVYDVLKLQNARL